MYNKTIIIIKKEQFLLNISWNLNISSQIDCGSGTTPSWPGNHPFPSPLIG
jgi:hypothetical protein